MKLVIDHSLTKREINGTFDLCGSRADLTALAEQIMLRLEDKSWGYGWVTIYPPVQPKINTTPTHWDI